MGGRRRRPHRRAKVEKPPADSPAKTPSSGSSGVSEERVAPRKIHSSSAKRHEEDEVEQPPADSPAKTPSSGSSGVSEERVASRKIHSSSAKRHEEDEVISVTPRKGADPRALTIRLLNLVRTFYLEALSRLPAADLWRTHARGVLVAGHCYGPLSPVDNILVSAIWYDTAFPLRPNAEFHFGDVLETSSESLARIAHRSLEGLIACLRHVCPSLSRDDALWHLHLSRADLFQAIASASGSSSVPTQAAFLVAAEAAHHPVPRAMALFASTILPKVEDEAGMLLRVNRLLSTSDLDRLSTMLVPCSLPEDLCPPPPLVSPRVAAILKHRIRISKESQKSSCQIIEAALRKYSQETGQHYELHFICGGNVLIYLKIYWHMNFLARRKDTAELPIYFFVEAAIPGGDEVDGHEEVDGPKIDGHEDEDEDLIFTEENIRLCCPITPSRVGGCTSCTAQYKKIDHPTDKEHYGGSGCDEDEFGNGDDKWGYNWPLYVDYILFDAERDIATVRHMEEFDARWANGEGSVERYGIVV